MRTDMVRHKVQGGCMGRGIEAVRRAGTSDDGQAPHSPNLSRDIGFPNAHRRQQRAPPAAPSHHRSAPLRTSSSSSSINGDEARQLPKRDRTVWPRRNEFSLCVATQR